MKNEEPNIGDRAEGLFRFMFEQSPQSIQVFAPDGRTLRVNRAWEELWGVTLDQIGDYNVLEDPQLVAKGIMPYIKRGFAGEATAIPAVLYDPDETISDITKHHDPRRWVRAFIHPVKDALGRVSEVVLVHEDITHQKRSEKLLSESEEQFRLLFENSRDAIVIADDTGNYLKVNDAACELLGYPREQLLRMNVSDLQTTNSPDAATLYQIYSRKGSETGEFSFVRPDGEWRIAQFTASRFAPGLHLSILRDISLRRRAEDALRESEDRYRDLVENSHELICTHDLEGRVLSVNPWAARVLGYEQSSLIGMNIRDGLAPGYRHEFDQYLQAIKRDGFAKGVMQARTAGGEFRVWEYHNTLRTEGVEKPIVRGMAHDVTERRQALAREKEARKEAEEANRLKDEFLATVSHELRTPLTAILGWSYMLNKDQLDEDTRQRAAEIIERNAHAQQQIIEDILDVSRIITGKIRLDAHPVELSPILEAVRETLQPAADAKQIKLHAALDSGTGPILGDPDRLQQVLWNLLSNAIKFTPEGGRVDVRLTRSESHINITVNDTGQGIAPEFLPYVFDRFRQADSSTTRMHGGLGLGLSIVRHLVELHGGSVIVESGGEGLGTTFTVTLPLLLAGGQQQQQPASAEANVATRNAISPDRPVRVKINLTGLRVLVVEDDEDALELMKMALGGLGAAVTTAASAAEALAVLGGMKPDALICDIGMPEMDGYELIRRVRALSPPQGGNIPAAALTAYAREEDKQKALAAGFQKHLAKPVTPDELATTVIDLCR